MMKTTKKINIFLVNFGKGVKMPTQSEQAFYQNATSNPLLVKKLVRKKKRTLSPEHLKKMQDARKKK